MKFPIFFHSTSLSSNLSAIIVDWLPVDWLRGSVMEMASSPQILILTSFVFSRVSSFDAYVIGNRLFKIYSNWIPKVDWSKEAVSNSQRQTCEHLQVELDWNRFASEKFIFSFHSNITDIPLKYGHFKIIHPIHFSLIDRTQNLVIPL